MILFVSATFPPEPGVSASLAHDLASELSESYSVRVLTPRPSRPFGFSFNEESIKNRKFEQIILNSYTCSKYNPIGRIRESYSFGKHVVEYIKNHRGEIDCIYVDSWPLLAQYLIVKTSKRFSIPSIIRIDDVYPESLLGKLQVFTGLLVKLLVPLDKWILKNSSKVVTISNEMKQFLIRSRKLDERKVEIVYNWQDEERFIAYKNNKGKENRDELFTFMFLGNLNKTAAVDIILSAFKISNLKDSHLVIAGNGSEKCDLTAIAESFRNVNIEFWDAPIKDVPSIQDKADVMLLNLRMGNSRFSLPSKLTAYMLSGKPIIACVEEDSETAFTIRRAKCGWISPPENPEALAEVMKKVSGLSKNTLNDFGKNGFEYALENFSKKKNIQRMTSIIKETFTC